VNKLFPGFGKIAEPKKPIVVVSGLPRSGTSMMMKMLAEGGLSVVTDAIRSADDDNPNGYFELEAVKQMSAGNVAWLDEAGGRVVKVISALLEHLPSQYLYKVIFMEREIKEVLASQKKMLVNRQEESTISDGEMEEQFRKHVAAVKAWLVRQPNMEVLYVSYNAMVNEPSSLCKKVIDFLELPLDYNRMLAVPNERLYRNRNVSS
jgi:predicted ATPase